MKRATIITTIVLFSNTCMADFLGPPRAGSGSGIGFEYLSSQMDLDADGVFGLADTELEDVEFDKIYGVLRGGVSPNMEIFLRLGIVDIEVDPGVNTDDLGYYIGSSDSEFTIGGGAKVTILEKDDITWGLAAQISYADLDFESTTGMVLGGPASLDASADILEVQLGIGPTIEINKGLSVYGGAMYHFVHAWADFIAPSSTSQSTDLEADSQFGGFIGCQIEYDKTTNLVIEYQTTGDSYAFGISLMYLFGEKTTGS